MVLCAARLASDDADPTVAWRLGAAGVDWERVVELAGLGQVGPLVYHGLVARGPAASVPEAARSALQGQYVGNLLRQREMAAILGAILARLAPAGIPVLAHKGVALACTVYPDPALRIAGDLDLSVPDAGPIAGGGPGGRHSRRAGAGQPRPPQPARASRGAGRRGAP